MSDELDTPQWRPPPTRVGPMENDTPAWLELLERVAPTGCVVVCAATLLLAGYAWGLDWLAGHL